MDRANQRPEVKVKPSSYQPTKAELEEEFHIDATPEELIGRLFRPAKIVEDPDA